MKRLVIAAAAAGLLGPLVPASPARAEDIAAYQADGEADAATANAKVAALDEAFGKAVAQAVGELVDAEVRRQNKPAIDRELIGHARLWVINYKIVKEAVADDRKQLQVSVRVDRDKLRAKLAELNIALKGAAGEAPVANAQVATVLLRVATPGAVHASYGSGAEKDVPGLAVLSAALRRASFAVKRAPGAGPAARGDGGLPLEDGAAESIGADVKADVVAVAGVTVGAPVPLRGVDASGVLIDAQVRLIDRKAHKSLGQGSAVTAARGSDPGMVDQAIARALSAALADVLPPAPQDLAQTQEFTGDDRPAGEPGIVLVRLARATPWGMVQSEIKHLIGAKGVSHATLRHVSPAGWVIGVATADSIDRIASIVKKPPASDTQVAVKVVGDLVEATLSGAP
ncbi:MAG TPA: hypothetical protein VH165_24445 [Kofleriaceae bacterium]|nr:hypothetical protein [Kofleriaceae bacterium]